MINHLEARENGQEVPDHSAKVLPPYHLPVQGVHDVEHVLSPRIVLRRKLGETSAETEQIKTAGAIFVKEGERASEDGTLEREALCQAVARAVDGGPYGVGIGFYLGTLSIYGNN